MTLPEVCIKRPVFATMLVVCLVVLGAASFTQLGLDLIPKVDFPTITITTRLEGASPEEVESQITKPIEEAINTISGLDELRSTTIEGRSQVFATFVLERNVDEAANDVREKVSTIAGQFPPGTDPPIIEKLDPDATPVLTIVISGKRTAREVSEIADKRIKRQLETVKDVGSITFAGDRKREIQILVDPDRLRAHNLSIAQVRQALLKQNAEIPGGRVTWQIQDQGLRTLGRIERVADFNDLIVADFKGAPVRLADLGQVVDGEEEPRTLSRLDGSNAVSLRIRKQSGTNTVAVVDALRAKLAEVQRTLPPDISIQEVQDLSRFIRRTIHEVEEHLILGAVLASLVVAFFIGNLAWRQLAGLFGILGIQLAGFFLVRDPALRTALIATGMVGLLAAFLLTRKLRAAFIAALAIPTSLIGTFTIMRYMGFTLNNLTLLGLSLSTGIVIDDAIIVVENIFRHMEEEGRSPMDAAQVGTKEIALAVMATTLSLVVIFLPVAFMGGIVGRFWKSFGLTAAFAIMVSLLVAFTLTPMLSSRLLRPEDGAGARGGSKESRFYRVLSGTYDRMLRWCLAHRPTVVLMALAIVLSAVAIFPYVKKEFIIDDDMSEFEVIVLTPPGSSLDRSDAILRELEGRIRRIPEVALVFTTIGIQGQFVSKVTDASVYVGLKHLSQRARSQEEIKQEVRKILADYPDLRTSVQQISIIQGGGFRQTPFNYIIRGPDLDRLDESAQTLIRRLAAVPGFVDLDTAQASREPEIQVHIDRKKASDVGVNVEAIASSLRTLVGGEKVGIYREGDEAYNVRLRLLQDYRKDASVISQLTVPGAGGHLVRLNNVTTLATGRSPAQIDRYAQERQITVVANLYRLGLGDAIALADGAVQEMNLPPQYGVAKTGRAKLFGEAIGAFAIAFGLSIAFIYMVLAAQFESFLHPITIMVSLPLSLPFGLLSLLYTGNSLNIYSAFGLMMLFGVVKKNSILQVDYTNVLRARGLPRGEAIITADHARLRPILMTTITIIAGMLPLALGRGDGSASRASMAMVVVGGQALCLFITLLVTPVVYSLLDDLRGLRLRDLALTPARVRAWVANGYARIANSRSSD